MGDDQDRPFAAQPFDDPGRELILNGSGCNQLFGSFVQTFKGNGNSRLRRIGGQCPGYGLGPWQDDNRLAEFEPYCGFRKRPVLAFNRYQGFSRVGNNHVAGVAHVGRNRYGDKGIGRYAARPRQDANDLTSGLERSPGSSFHDPAEPAANQDRTAPGDFAPDCFGQDKPVR